MSWMQRLYDTYEQAIKLDLSQDQRIPPIRHTIQNAHINIVLNENAKFVRARVLKKNPVVLPATEASEARANVDAPHGLADKIQYVAKDYVQWGGRKKSFFESYLKQLRAWCQAGAPRKVELILDYVSHGRVFTDLIEKAKIFQASSPASVLTSWPDGRGEAPEIFNSLPKDGGLIEPGSALICWSVEIPGDVESDTWKDSEIWSSWVNFQSLQESQSGLCLMSGTVAAIARLHPSKLRHSGDKAKLISANDQDGMTFRGRFFESTEAASLSGEVTQKAHNALRWLISRQGVRNGNQVTIAWAISGKPLLNPVDDWSYLESDNWSSISSDVPAAENDINHGNDLGYQITHRLNLKLRGYQQELKATEQLSLMVLDSATPGRMAIGYYREFLPNEYFKKLNAWYDQFSWYQRVTREIEVPGKAKKDKKAVWPIVPPAPLAIAQAVYGNTLSDDLKKQVYVQVLPCIVEGRQIPEVLVMAAVHRASNPMALEPWERWRNLGVACALFKGFLERSQQRRYDVALEETNRSRDYLFGRLLGLADHIEEYALSITQETRPTTAMRLMQRFSNHPKDTWKNIEEALHPYFVRVRGRYPSMEKAFRGLLDDVHFLMSEAEQGLFDNAPLKGEYLLGYHLQRRWLKDHTIDEGKWVLKVTAGESSKPASRETQNHF